MTARLKAAPAKPASSLTQPAGIEDLLDYQLYLLYRDCGYVIERLCQVEFGVSRRRWRILATLSAAEGITVSDLSMRAELDIAQTSRAIGTLAREGCHDMTEDQVQQLCTAISILRNTATHLNASSSLDADKTGDHVTVP